MGIEMEEEACMGNRGRMAGEVWRRVGVGVAVALVAGASGLAQAPAGATDASKPAVVYEPIPGFDATSMDKTVDPCNDFYKFACGKFAANHPIPADQPAWTSSMRCSM